ncbi:putative nuclease HARBI1 [Clupea harengus]|uniref:Nuclease HARBI1 n=1 Tax=Clupea harengus TaxID=7950 RepID=A0A8M1KTN8_CLUHA|nr:putative nuclease HARBI1 [Clupea harengus]
MDMLKGRWRCLDASGGRLLYDPEKVYQISLACCVLHNICLSHGIELREDEMRWLEYAHHCTEKTGPDSPTIPTGRPRIIPYHDGVEEEAGEGRRHPDAGRAEEETGDGRRGPMLVQQVHAAADTSSGAARAAVGAF